MTKTTRDVVSLLLAKPLLYAGDKQHWLGFVATAFSVDPSFADAELVETILQFADNRERYFGVREVALGTLNKIIQIRPELITSSLLERLVTIAATARDPNFYDGGKDRAAYSRRLAKIVISTIEEKRSGLTDAIPVRPFEPGSTGTSPRRPAR